MASVLHPVTACFKKAEIMEEKEKLNTSDENKSFGADNETCSANPGLISKMSSHLYNLGSGAIGFGVNSVKWAASTTYPVVSGVVSATQTVVSKVVPSAAVPKSKKE